MELGQSWGRVEEPCREELMHGRRQLRDTYARARTDVMGFEYEHSVT